MDGERRDRRGCATDADDAGERDHDEDKCSSHNLTKVADGWARHKRSAAGLIESSHLDMPRLRGFPSS